MTTTRYFLMTTKFLYTPGDWRLEDKGIIVGEHPAHGRTVIAQMDGPSHNERTREKQANAVLMTACPRLFRVVLLANKVTQHWRQGSPVTTQLLVQLEEEAKVAIALATEGREQVYCVNT
jgi:hypothetical protein